MPKTKEITIICDEAKIESTFGSSISVEIDSPKVFDLLDNLDREDIINWLEKNLNPEDVFSTTQLDKWAESEGYIKQSENG